MPYERDTLRELNPAEKPSFDAIVANPPLMNAPAFTLRAGCWQSVCFVGREEVSARLFAFSHLYCVPVPLRSVICMSRRSAVGLIKRVVRVGMETMRSVKIVVALPGLNERRSGRGSATFAGAAGAVA